VSDAARSESGLPVAPVYGAARLPGWTAHIAEQHAANSLIRPLADYSGPAERHVPAASSR
jgi:citrate synthase